MTHSTLTLVDVQPTPVTLPDLAEQINAEHRQCEAAAAERIAARS